MDSTCLCQKDQKKANLGIEGPHIPYQRHLTRNDGTCLAVEWSTSKLALRLGVSEQRKSSQATPGRVFGSWSAYPLATRPLLGTRPSKDSSPEDQDPNFFNT